MLLFYYAIDEADAGVLTDTPTNLSQDNLDVSFMIPQPLTALSTANRAVSGNYIQVDCEIFDTASGAKIWQNAKTDPSLLVAETDYGKIYFPLTTETLNEWQAGHAGCICIISAAFGIAQASLALLSLARDLQVQIY